MRVAIKELSGIRLVQTQSCGLEKGGMHASREAEGAEGWGKAVGWQTRTSLLQRPRNPTQGDKGIMDIYTWCLFSTHKDQEQALLSLL